jgi:hypothetical protein
VAVANIVKRALSGPVGLDKITVDDIGDVTITNDGACILKIYSRWSTLQPRSWWSKLALRAARQKVERDVRRNRRSRALKRLPTDSSRFTPPASSRATASP